jgi:hypothetical protein
MGNDGLGWIPHKVRDEDYSGHDSHEDDETANNDRSKSHFHGSIPLLFGCRHET